MRRPRGRATNVRARSSTPFAGANRIRFEGLRSPALSAPGWRSPVVRKTLHLRGRRRPTAVGCDNGRVLLRMLRRRRAGSPSLLARVVAALLVLGMLGLAAPLLAAPLGIGLRWLLALL